MYEKKLQGFVHGLLKPQFNKNRCYLMFFRFLKFLYSNNQTLRQIML
jgi:hypothetical protein